MAITGCGVVVLATRSSTPFSNSNVRHDVPSTAIPPGAMNCSSIFQPALIASAINT